jgi:5-methylcytosine-specific restriction endonuclease McrA
MVPNNTQTLVLNADYRPISNMPLSTCSWQDAVTAVLKNRVYTLHEYDEYTVHSQNFSMKVPSVIVLKSYVSPRQFPRFTRFNVYTRDRFTCQYCNTKFPTQDLTFDHVVPLSRGGKTTWSNIVTACRKCNSKKGNMMMNEINMFPINSPRVPSHKDLVRGLNKQKFKSLHQTWIDYVYWDSDLMDD